MRTTEIARGVLQRLEQAWNAGDGEAYGRPYADEAWFVNLQGLLAYGREAIAAGHARIFDTIYAGSTNRMQLVDARRVADDVIVSTARNTLDCPHGPLVGVHQAIVTSLLMRSADRWAIVASQTTLVTVQSAPVGAR